MKNLFYLIFLAFTLTIFSCENKGVRPAKKNDLEKENLKGKVKSIVTMNVEKKETKAATFNEQGNLTGEYRYMKIMDEFYPVKTYEYHSNGNLSMVTEFTDAGEPKKKQKFNDKGHITEEYSCFATFENGKKVFKEKKTYAYTTNEYGDVVKKASLTNDSYTEYEYDAAGNVTLESYVDRSPSLNTSYSRKFKHKYDGDGRLIWKEYIAMGRLTADEYFYDENGRVIQIKYYSMKKKEGSNKEELALQWDTKMEYDEHNNNTLRGLYEYDRKGNWIECIDPYDRYVRDITYYH